jgi:hypothetical protein
LRGKATGNCFCRELPYPPKSLYHKTALKARLITGDVVEKGLKPQAYKNENLPSCKPETLEAVARALDVRVKGLFEEV